MKKLQILIIVFLISLSICALASMQAKAHGTAVSITVCPATDSITAGNSVTYTATATDAYNNSWDVTNSVTWSISSGAIGKWSNNTYTSATAGNWTVTADDGSCVTGTASLTVTPASIVSIAVSPATDSITAGNSVTYTATATDAYNNSWDVTNSVTWSISSGAIGKWSNNTYTSATAGNWTVTADNGTGVTGNASLTVTPSALAQFVFRAINSPQTAGTSFSVTIKAVDSYGNTVTSYIGTPSLTYSAGSISPGATNAFVSGVGSTSVTVTATGSNVTLGVNGGSGHTGTSNPFTVDPGVAVSVALSPDSATITAGNSETYTATASDAYDNTWNVTSSTSWNISSGAGGSWNSNVYTSATAGTWTVTGTYASTAYTTGLTVNPASLDHFIFNTIATQTAGTPFIITITAKDAYGNTVTSYIGTPSLTYSAGSISPGATNAFVSGVGSTSVTVTATGSNVTITATDDIHTGTSNSFTVTITPTPTPTPIPTASPTPFPTSTPIPKTTHTPTATSSPTSTATPIPASTSTPISTGTPTPSATSSPAPLLGLVLPAIVTLAIILILILIAIKRRRRKPVNKLSEVVSLRNTIGKVKNLEAEKKNLLHEVEKLKKKAKAKATA